VPLSLLCPPHPIGFLLHLCWLLLPGVPHSTPLVCNPTNVIPFRVFIVVPRIPWRIQPALPPPSFLVAHRSCHSFFAILCFCLFPLICLNSPTLCLFPNLYYCNHAIVYQLWSIDQGETNGEADDKDKAAAEGSSAPAKGALCLTAADAEFDCR
jgi:hypothetical protein